MSKVFFVLLCSSLIAISAYGQGVKADETLLLKKIALYSKAHPSACLFVHIDKTIYTNNEDIWFSSYLLKTSSLTLKEHTVLSVALIGEVDRKVYLQEKYMMEQGLSSGSITLPDTIPPGNYQFTASTNALDKNNNPLVSFSQAITIKSISEQSFSASLTLLDTVATNGAVRVKVELGIKNPDKKQKASIAYQVGTGAKKTLLLNENSYVITVPAESLNQPAPVLLTSVSYNSSAQYLSIKLPENRQENLSVRFFPEGGNLVAGLSSTIGWEAKTSKNRPAELRGVLYRDGLAIDTISTKSNGTGTFKLTPDGKSRYSLKIAANAYQKQETLYPLPEAITEGLSMHLAEAVIHDTLRMNLYSTQVREVQILVHNYREAFAYLKVKVQPSGSRLAIAIPSIIKGLATVTVLDQEALPLAERLIFARYGQKITVKTSFDKPAYAKRDSVAVVLKLTDSKGNPVQGILSVAAVQDNRMERSKARDIETYGYLESELGALPLHYSGRGISDKAYLEDMLLTKGWRRYTWQSLLGSTEKDTIIQNKPFAISGRVKYNSKPLKKPAAVTIFNGTGVHLVNTTADGSFNLKRDELLTSAGKELLVSVNKESQYGYAIEVDEPFLKINQKLASGLEIQDNGTVNARQSTGDLELKGMQKAIALKAVVVSAQKSDNALYYATIRRVTNACGDYVCVAGTLNCPVHPFDPRNTKPIKGKVYGLLSVSKDGRYMRNEGSRMYWGCVGDEEKEQRLTIKGIYASREFYGVSKELADAPEPKFLSTLFWKPDLVFKNGEAKLSFYTGDISGKFRLVVQGVEENDLVFGEAAFNVK